MYAQYNIVCTKQKCAIFHGVKWMSPEVLTDYVHRYTVLVDNMDTSSVDPKVLELTMLRIPNQIPIFVGCQYNLSGIQAVTVDTMVKVAISQDPDEDTLDNMESPDWLDEWNWTINVTEGSSAGPNSEHRIMPGIGLPLLSNKLSIVYSTGGGNTTLDLRVSVYIRYDRLTIKQLKALAGYD